MVQKTANNKQEVMIGYSDSSKDAGKISASYISIAQEQIVKLGKKYKIKLLFSWKRWVCWKRRRFNSSNFRSQPQVRKKSNY